MAPKFKQSTQLGGKVKNAFEFIIWSLIDGFNAIDSAIAHNSSLHQENKQTQQKNNRIKTQAHKTKAMIVGKLCKVTHIQRQTMKFI